MDETEQGVGPAPLMTEHSLTGLDGPLDGPDCSPRNNNKYYMEDTMSIFLVENQRFKVHRHFLVQESDVFKWMFICPPGSGEPDGSTDERPILLPGVTAIEFQTLLDFFYTEKFQRHDALMEEWIELLAISTRFDFQRLRECAIDAIDHSRWRMQRPWNRRISIDPIEQIILAEKHDPALAPHCVCADV